MVDKIKVPPAPRISTDTSNMVTSAAPRSPARLLVFIFVSRFMAGYQAPSVIDKVTQDYVGRELYLRRRLITVRVWSADRGQRHADGDDDKLRCARRHFALIAAGSILHIRDVTNLSAVDCPDGRVVRDLLVVVTKDQ